MSLIYPGFLLPFRAVATVEDTGWSLVSQGTAVVDPVGSPSAYGATINLSGSTQEGDVVVVAQCCDGSTPNRGVENFTTRFSSEDIVPNCSVATFMMTSSPITSFNVQQSSTLKKSVGWQIWRGANTTTLLDVAAQSAWTTATAAANAPAITTANDGSLVLRFCFVDDIDVAAGAAYPSGYVNQLATDTGDGQTSNNGATILMCSKYVASAALEAAAAFGVSAAEDTWTASIALRKAGV